MEKAALSSRSTTAGDEASPKTTRTGDTPDGSLIVQGRPPVRFASRGSPSQAYGVFDEPSLAKRCLKDVRSSSADLSAVPSDHSVLLVELDGVLLRSRNEKKDEFDIRPHAMDFLLQMKWEAGLALGVFTRSKLADAVQMVKQLEAERPDFLFDFVICADTLGAWEGGEPALASLSQSGVLPSAFFLDAARDVSVGVQDHVAYVPRFDENSNEDEVFHNLELKDARLRRWLATTALSGSSFRRTVSEELDMCHPAASVLSMNGVPMPEVGDDPASPPAQGLPPPLPPPAESARASKRSISRTISGSTGFSKGSGFSGFSNYAFPRRLSQMTSVLSHRFTKKTSKPSFDGEWVCESTWGLDEFLKGMGIGRVQRMAAMKAPWPSWRFQQDDDNFVFVNQSFLGDIREEFQVGGPEYTQVDGKKQKLLCKAVWEDSTLVIDRKGPQGEFQERRHIDSEGKLQFKLLKSSKQSTLSWGRTFRRK